MTAFRKATNISKNSFTSGVRFHSSETKCFDIMDRIGTVAKTTVPKCKVMSDTKKPETPKERKIFGTDIRIVACVMGFLGVVGLTTFIIAFVTIWGGRRLDAQFGTSPWIMVGIGIVGLVFVIGIITIASISVSKRMQIILKDMKEKEGQN